VKAVSWRNSLKERNGGHPDSDAPGWLKATNGRTGHGLHLIRSGLHRGDEKMPTLFKIIITNNSLQLMYFSLIQAASTFASSANVSSSSLDCQPLRPFSDAGTTLSFSMDPQIYAGAQEIMPSGARTSAAANARLAPSLASAGASQTSAVQAIELTPANGGNPSNYTSMLVNPIGLSRANFNANVAKGAFCIAIPPYTPPIPSYTIGNATINQEGSVILSSFISAPPNQEVSVSVSQIYYVAAAQYATGSIVNYGQAIANAAKCDFTTGYTTYTTNYQADGTFSPPKPSY
jgi:hypothetical protein